MGEILGIGIEELIFVGILIALLFGPESIPKMARTAGRALNRLFRSPLYRESQQIRKQIQDLPAALARLAELEEMQKNLNNEISDLRRSIDPGLSQAAPSTTLSPSQPAATPGPGTQVEPPTSDASPPEPDANSDHSIGPPHAPPHPAADEPSHATR